MERIILSNMFKNYYFDVLIRSICKEAQGVIRDPHILSKGIRVLAYICTPKVIEPTI